MRNPFFFFRIKQLGRFFQRTGFGYIILILFLLSGMFLQGLANFLLLSDFSITATYVVFLLVLLFNRTDYLFLAYIEQSLLTVYLVDASLAALIWILPLLLLGRWEAVLAVVGMMFLIPLCWSFVVKFLSSSSEMKSNLKFDFPLLAVDQFELRYLLRRYGVVLGIGYLVALFFSWHPAAIFIFSFLFLAFFQSVLEFYEPKEMIFNRATSSEFLFYKAFKILVVIQLVFLPLYLVSLFFSFGYWYLFAIVFLAICMMVLFSVFNKYVFYRPGLKQVKTNVIAGIMLLFLLIPGFQLVVLMMSVIQFYKAKNNLEIYW